MTTVPALHQAFRSSDASPPAPRTRTALPTTRALDLSRATRRALELAFQRGVTPDIDALVGWEFRGINWTPPGCQPLAQLAGIKKFVKGMFRAGDGRVMGYNCPVVQNVLDGRWRTKPSDTAPRRFGFYEIAPVDATARDNHYLHALLLDYGKGGNAAWDATRGLRDYLVQVDESNPDLLLGKAYYALGPARVPAGFFILERFRRAPAELPVQHRT
ncbi:MAG TPA: hypothetical protein VHN14_30390 [Kofleriaceae bacterium]|jgi:hypothetical protein|nr:hypothetical protein [Kofleriaceae bacterium]